MFSLTNEAHNSLPKEKKRRHLKVSLHTVWRVGYQIQEKKGSYYLPWQWFSPQGDFTYQETSGNIWGYFSLLQLRQAV